MTIDQFIIRLDAVRLNLVDDLSEWLNLRAAKDVIAEVTNRVELKGQKAEGGQFSKYSKSYAAYRKSEGRQSSYKDFSFTRQMWKSFQVQDKKQTLFGTEVTARMGEQVRSSGETNQEIMEKHSERENSELVAMSEQEQERLTARTEAWMIAYLNKGLS